MWDNFVQDVVTATTAFEVEQELSGHMLFRHKAARVGSCK